MITEINDDFDPEKIYMSGQAFRIRQYDDGGYRFLNGEHALYLRKEDDERLALSCTEEQWRDIWFPYFDLGRNYRDIRRNGYGKNDFADAAMDFGEGIRVLRQDPWETLVTFIISQRKNIPAISKAVETLSEKFGHEINTGYETLCSFPTPEELSRASEEDLRNCSLGYRAPYLMDAADCVLTGRLELDSLDSLGDEELIAELKKVRGVGIKVASCVALFAYARMGSVPIDVWIARAIEEDCGGESPFELFGENAGIIQQYVYFYERSTFART